MIFHDFSYDTIYEYYFCLEMCTILLIKEKVRKNAEHFFSTQKHPKKPYLVIRA